MKTVTARVACDELEPSEGAIILTGPPGALRGTLTLSNRGDAAVFLRSAALEPAQAHENLLRRELDIDLHLAPGQTRQHRLSVALDEHTPPGEYSAMISVGGKQRQVRVIVQPQLQVELVPNAIHLIGIAPGLTHEAQVLFVNRGNIPLTIPTLHHHTTVDLDLVCRNLSLALRDQTAETSEATLDVFIKGLKHDLAGWVELNAREAGQLVNACESRLLHLTLKLPPDIRPERMYDGEIRICNQLLRYTITPGPRKTEAGTVRRPRAGSATKGDHE